VKLDIDYIIELTGMQVPTMSFHPREPDLIFGTQRKHIEAKGVEELLFRPFKIPEVVREMRHLGRVRIHPSHSSPVSKCDHVLVEEEVPYNLLFAYKTCGVTGHISNQMICKKATMII
jgi:hypothetical protein